MLRIIRKDFYTIDSGQEMALLTHFAYEIRFVGTPVPGRAAVTLPVTYGNAAYTGEQKRPYQAIKRDILMTLATLK